MPTDVTRQQRALSSAHIMGDKMSQKRAVARLRASLAEFTETNQAKVQELFNQAAAENPAEALRIWLATMEFVVPKLSRTEVVATDETGEVREMTMDMLRSIVDEERERAELDALTS